MGNAVFSVQAIMTLQDLISGKLSAITAKLAATGRSAAALGLKMASLAKAMLPVVAAAGLVFGGLTAAAMSTVKTQKALGELASVGVQNMGAMEAAATKFSNNFAGTSKSDFIAAAYDIKSGIASLSDEGVAAFTDLAALTGKATKSTVDVMTSLFATGYNIYKKSYAQLSDLQFGELFSAGISASVQQFKTTGTQMSAGISQLGATATNAGIRMQEQFAVLGMLQGTMSGSESGTKYRQFVAHAAKAGKELGLNFLDANKQLKTMPQILTELHKKFGDTLDATEKLKIQKGFGSEEAVATIDLLYNKLGELNSNINIVGGAMGKGRGFTLAMAQTMNKDLGASIQKAGQRLHNLVEIIGGMFAPILQTVVDGVSDFVLVLQDGASWLASTGWGSAIMGIVAGLSALTVVSTAVAAGMWAMAVAGPVVTAALAPLGTALGVLGAPIWVVIGLVALLVVAWKTNFGGMRDTLMGWWNKITLVVQGVKAVFASLTGSTGELKGQLARDIEAKGLLGLVTSVGKTVFRVRQFFVYLWDAFQDGTKDIGNIFAPLASAFAPILHALTPLWDGLKKLLGLGVDSKLSTWGAAGRLVGDVLGFAFRTIAFGIRMATVPLQLFGALFGYVIGLFTGQGGTLADLGKSLGNVFSSIWQSAQAAFPAVTAIIEGFVSWVGGLLSSLGSALSAVWAGLGESVAPIVAGLAQTFAALDPVGWITAAFAGVGEALSGAFAQVTSLLSTIDLSAAGAAIIHTLVAGVTSAAGSLWGAVKGAFNGVSNLIPHSDAKEGPLSTLTASGRAIMTTMAFGVQAAGPALAAATSGAMAGAASTLAMDTPGLPDLTGTASWQTVPPPAINLPEATQSQSTTESSRQATGPGRGRSGVTIQNLSVTLPDVTDGDGFVRSLQRLVEGYSA